MAVFNSHGDILSPWPLRHYQWFNWTQQISDNETNDSCELVQAGASIPHAGFWSILEQERAPANK